MKEPLRDSIYSGVDDYSIGDTVVFFDQDGKTMYNGIIDYITVLKRDYYYHMVVHSKGSEYKELDLSMNRHTDHTHPSRQILTETIIQVQRYF